MSILGLKYLQTLKVIKGKRIKHIFYQPTKEVLGDNIFVLNFCNELGEVNYSLHVSCFLRAIKDRNILLTSSDVYFSFENEKLSKEEDIKDTLIFKNLKIINKLLSNTFLEDIIITSTADLILKLNNGLKFEIMLDCLYNNYEFYRFIDFINKKDIVVSFKNNEICCY